MSNLPRKQSNFEVAPPQKPMPLVQSFLVGRRSHFLPIIMLYLFISACYSSTIPFAFMLPGIVFISLGWYFLRFGYQLRIWWLRRSKKFREALDVSLKALHTFPDDSFALVYAALCYADVEEYELAIKYADTAIHRGERLPLAYFAKTKAEFSPDFKTSAIGMIPKDDDPLVLSKKLELEEREKEFDLTLQEMERFFSGINLQPPFLNISLAYYIARLGYLDRAQAELDKVKNSPLRDAKAYILSNEARIHLLRGQNDLALAASTQATELLPGDWQIAATHGLMLLRNDRIKDAETQLLHATLIARDMEVTAPEVSYFLAELLDKKGERVKAIAARDTALKHDYIPYL